MSIERIPIHNANGRNDRYRYDKFRHDDGKWYFVKTAQSTELAPNLTREILWADFLNHVASSKPEARLKPPRIIGFDANGGLVMEFINAALVARPSSSTEWRAKMSRYARMLTLLDECAEGYQAAWPEYSGFNIYNPDEVWQRWFGDHYDDAQVTLQSARTIIDEYRGFLTFRVQHGDLTPWQIFELNDEWIIYDGEKAGDHLPRYNDLAYGYGRLYTKLKDPAAAAELLAVFLNHSSIDHDEFFKQFLPVMTFRATGMLADAYSDRSHDDYYEYAVKLINLCLEERLGSFY